MLKEVGNSSGYEVLRYLTGVKQKQVVAEYDFCQCVMVCTDMPIRRNLGLKP